jgi:hypothetical protein
MTEAAVATASADWGAPNERTDRMEYLQEDEAVTAADSVIRRMPGERDEIKSGGWPGLRVGDRGRQPSAETGATNSGESRSERMCPAVAF